MIPILYGPNETAFTSNGLGRLTDCISCEVTEERNGVYEVEFVYPVTGIHYDDIQIGCIIYATHDATKAPQPFDIYKRSVPIDGNVTFNAHHISYRLSTIVARPFTVTGNIQAIFAALKNAAVNTCPFYFSSDKTASLTYTQSEPAPIRERLSGTQGSILDVFGSGDYEFDKWQVRFLDNRGTDRGVSIRYGKNLTDITAESNMEGSYTGCVPYWSGESGMVTLPEWYVLADGLPAGSPVELIVMDLSGDFEAEPTVAQLRSKAKSKLNSSNAWLPEENIEVEFEALWQTTEYADVEALQRVLLCDTVSIIYTTAGVTVKKRVIKTVYNSLLDRYVSLELGQSSATLASTIQQRTETALQKTFVSRGQLADVINYNTQLITGGLGGYVVFKQNANGQPEEILIMDTDDTQTAVNVIRMNKNGIGFSTTGYAGPFTSAWTIAGVFNTNFIAANSIAVSKLSGSIKDSGNTWTIDLTNGTMTIGNISANNITTGTLSADRIGGHSLPVGKMSGSLTGGASNSWGIDFTNGTLTIGTLAVGKITGTLGSTASGSWGIDFTNGIMSIGNISAANITTGTLSADRIGSHSVPVGKLSGSISGGISSSWGIDFTNGTLTIGSISASNITTGTLSADRIGGHSLPVGKLSGSLSGGLNSSWGIDFTTGTLTIGNISAANITAGSLSADRIAANSITVSKLTGSIKDSGNTWEINLTNGTLTLGSISASNITAGTFSADWITAGTITAQSGGNSWNLNTGIFTSTDGTRKTQISAGRISFYKGSDTTGNIVPAAWGGDYENAEGVVFLASSNAKYLGIGHQYIEDSRYYWYSDIVINNGLNPGGYEARVHVRAGLRLWHTLYVMGNIIPTSGYQITIGTSDLRFYQVWSTSFNFQTGVYMNYNSSSDYIYASKTIHQGSDENLKNITPYDPRYDQLIELLEPVIYTWKDSPAKRTHAGLGARATKYMVDSLGLTDSGFVGIETGEDGTEIYSVDYSELTVMLLHIVQKLKKEVDSLKGVA